MRSQDAGLHDRAAALEACSHQLIYAPGGRLLGPHRSCGQRLCPTCQARRATRWAHRVRDALPELSARPGRWVFLTLTMRNVPLGELRAGLTRLHRAVDRLTHRREWAPRGWIRQTEVTINAATGEAHPHVHMLLLMPADYSPRRPPRRERSSGGRPRIVAGYMSQKRLRELWAAALGADYDPRVWVQLLAWEDESQRRRAVLEVCKYGVKPAELAGLSAGDLATLIGELGGTRTFSSCGELRPVFQRLQQEERWRREYEALERRGKVAGPAQQRRLAAVATWDGKRYQLAPVALLPRHGSQLAGGTPAPSPTGYQVRPRPPVPELAPLPPADFIGDVWCEPENFALDRRAEMLKCAELQRAKPERAYFGGP